MRDSVTGIRNQLAMMENAAEQDLQWLVNGNGLFATFAMTPAQCERMGSEFAIHMPDTGRINIAGLTQESVERFAMALKSVKEVHVENAC
jgi:aspartate/tyrosine/aromatic aminotransferase